MEALLTKYKLVVIIFMQIILFGLPIVCTLLYYKDHRKRQLEKRNAANLQSVAENKRNK